MDKIALALGITGTGGVVIGIVAYLIAKGIRSNCLAAKMEMNFDLHKVDSNKSSQSISNLTRAELETVILEILAKHRRSSAGNVHGGNIIIPNILQSGQPSLKEIEEMIKDTIHDARGSPGARSRSGSEDSHISHKSQHSKCKDDHIVILKDDL